MKKLLSLLLILTAVVFSLSACNGYKESSEGLEFELNSDGESYTLTGIGTCTESNIIVSGYEGKPVTAIGDNAFAQCATVRSVTIDDCVRSIGRLAFSACPNLTRITIPESVTSIGDYAFNLCPNLIYSEYGNSCYLGNDRNSYMVLVKPKHISVTTVNIHTNTKLIYSHAFDSCSMLREVQIPGSVNSIGDYAFRYCTNLTSLTILSGVTKIGDYAFADCVNLTKVIIPDTVMKIGEHAFSSCKGIFTVCYEGGKGAWTDIVIGLDNEYLTNAYIQYNYGKN